MNGNDRFCKRRYRCLDKVWIDVIRCRINVDKHRHGPDICNRFSRRKKRVSRDQNLVTGTDADAQQRNFNGVCTVCDADTAFDAEIIGKFILKLSGVFAGDKRGLG